MNNHYQHCHQISFHFNDIESWAEIEIHRIFLFQAHITCDSEPGSVGSNGFIITRTNFVTLRYRTDSWGTNTNGFTLIITAFRQALGSNGCDPSMYQCASGLCISGDLVCDGVSHCGHGEEEGVCSGTGGSMVTIIGVLCVLLVLVSAVGTAACVWTCRQEQRLAAPRVSSGKKT